MKKQIITAILLYIISAFADTNVGGPIFANTTWTLANSPYNATTAVTVKTGATLTIEPGVTIKFNASSALTVEGCLIARGTAAAQIIFTPKVEADRWGYIYFADTAIDGVLDGSDNYVSGSILEYCTIEKANGKPNEGALSINNAKPCLRNCNVKNNNSTGVSTYTTSGTLIFKDFTITNNISTLRGGGVSGSGNTFTNCIISNNTTTAEDFWNGAGAGVAGNSNNFNNCTISYNSATGSYSADGGGVSGNMLSFSNCKIIGNTCNSGNGSGGNGGGGVYISSGGEGVFTNCTISDNTAFANGGGIYGSRGITITNCLFFNNKANGLGGAIYTMSAGVYAAIIKNCSFIGNQAVTQGGAISGIPNVESSLFLNNKVIGTNIENRGTIAVTSGSLTKSNILSNSTKYKVAYTGASGTTYNATNNYWGTTDINSILDMNYDVYDNSTYGEINFMPIANALDITAPISPPQNFTGIIHNGQIDLNWSANAESDLAGYKIYYDTDGYPYDNVISVNNVTSYTITGLTGSNYKVAICAIDNAAAGTTDDIYTGHQSWYSTEITPDLPPTIVVTPTALDFTTTFVGDSKKLVLKISNSGQGALTVSKIEGSELFKVSLDTVYSPIITDITIPAGGFKNINVKFTPAALIAYNQNLKIYSNDIDHSLVSVPVTGTGTNSPPVVNITAPAANADILLGTIVPINITATDLVKSITKVVVSIDGVEKATLTTAPYTYSWNTAGYALTNHTIKAVATDNDNGTAFKEVTVHINNGPVPVISITAPANNALIKKGLTVNISATATDPGKNSKVVTRVVFFLGNDSLGTGTANGSNYIYAWNTTAYPLKAYKIKAKAYDNSGNTKFDSISVTLVSGLPTIAITEPAPNANLISGSQVTVKALATDSAKAKTVSQVAFFFNNVEQGTPVTTAPYNKIITIPLATATGNYPIKVVVKDSDNNIKEASVMIKVTNSQPKITILSPLPNAILPTGTPVELKVFAMDSAKAITGKKGSVNSKTVTKVEFFVDNTPLGEGTYSGGFYVKTWEIPLANATAAHKIKARVTDNQNNTAMDSVAVKVVNSAPGITITAPANNYQMIFGDSVKVVANAVDSLKSVTKVSFFINDNTTAAYIDQTAPYEFNFKPTAIGEYDVKAVVTDNSNNVAQAIVHIKTVSGQPIVNFTAPTPGQSVSIGNPLEILATIIDPGKSKSITKAEFFVDGVSKTVLTAEPYRYIWNTQAASTGNHTIKIVATDNTNKTGESSVTVNLVSGLPLITLSGVSASEEIPQGKIVLLTAEAADSKSVKTVQFYVNNNLKSVDNSAPYNYAWNTTNEAIAGYTLKAVVIDNFGNSNSSTTIPVTVINSKPTITITNPANMDSVFAGTTVIVQATATDASKSVKSVEFLINGSTKVIDYDAPYSFAWNTTGLNGEQTITAVVRDNLGLSQQAEIKIKVKTITTFKITNSPNPFNPTTTINYAVPTGFNGLLNLSVYNQKGEKVRELVNTEHKAGIYKGHS